MTPEPKILHGVPLPALAKTGLTNFERMEVGDSFVAPLNGEPAHIAHGRMGGRAKLYDDLLGRKFVTRRVPGGIGVWRVR